jgi:3-hydroxy-3-methylglutaryl CoA synthase
VPARHESVGLLACGAALPVLRLRREVIAEAVGWLNPPGSTARTGARTICNWDEDTVTLAVAAARACISAGSGAATAAPASLWLASTTFPFADRDNAALVASALDIQTGVATFNAASSLRTATSALIAAAERGAAPPALVIGADARAARPGSAQEMACGHGAAALLVGPAGAAALAEFIASATRHADFVDHYRMHDRDYDYALEERWVRDEGLMKLVPDTVKQALTAVGVPANQVAHCVLPMPKAAARKLAATLGVPDAAVADSLAADCGDTGAAHPLLMLIGALERARAGEVIVLIGFGQGVDALVLRAGAGLAAWEARPLTAALAQRREETRYTRYLAHAGALDVDYGMRAERDNRSAQSVAWRRNREVNAFVGGRCRQCGTVQFPRFRVCVNPDCRATDTLDAHRLADSTGRVKSFTEDWQAYSPRPPYVYGNVEFAEGGNLLMEFTDIDAGDLAVGDSVRFVFRVKDIDRLRGFRRYFWKAVRS